MKIIKSSKNKQTIKMSRKEWLSIGEKAGWIKESWFPEREPEYRGDRVPMQQEPHDKHEFGANPLEYDKHEWINKPDSATCVRSGGKGDDESWSYTWVFQGRPSKEQLENWADDNNVDWSYYYGGPGMAFYEAAEFLRSGDRTIVKQSGGLDI